MSGYIAAHGKRISTGSGVYFVSRHNQREGAYDADDKPLKDWIYHPENKALNDLHCAPKDVAEAREKRLRDAGLKRKPQKNAAKAVEFSVSMSPEWLEGKDQKTIEAYLADALESLKKRYGADNLIGWATHYDETTPHLHALFVPIVNGKDGPKYSSSEFLGGYKELYALHDHLENDLSKYGLIRGERGKGDRHNDQRGWSRELSRREREVEQAEAMWKAREAELDQRERELAQIEAMWRERGAEVESLTKKANGVIKEGKAALTEGKAALAEAKAVAALIDKGLEGKPLAEWVKDQMQGLGNEGRAKWLKQAKASAEAIRSEVSRGIAPRGNERSR